MDRRTKFILLVIASIVLLGAVIWLIVIPLLSPVLPESLGGKAQPPAQREPSSPVINVPEDQANGNGTIPTRGTDGVVEVTPELSSDQLRIIELSRQARVLTERIESGSSANGFENLDEASLLVSPELASTFKAMQDALRAAHPASGPVYITTARALRTIPENEQVIRRNDFSVTIQLQIQIQEGDTLRSELKEATVSYVLADAKWIASGYKIGDLSLEQSESSIPEIDFSTGQTTTTQPGADLLQQLQGIQ